jgi:hypothetical protein
LQSVSFSTVGYLPAFVGTFIAGPAISKNTGATISIVGGWFHSELGRMYNMISMVPRTGAILKTTDLVLGLAVEEVSLDTIVTGGISVGAVGDIAQGRVIAYILRFNALFQSVAYGMRYVPVSAGDYSIGKAVLSVGSHLFLVCDAFDAQRNQTQLGVLKVDVATGSIVKQVQVAGPANVTCSSVVLSRGLLTIACGVREGLLLKPLIFTVDQDLTFKRLLSGYQRVVTNVVQAVPLEVVASVIAVTQSTSTVATSSGAFNSSTKLVQSSAAPTKLPTHSPTRMPTRTPTVIQPTGQPSSQPSAHPSWQPTSRPTAAPSVSPAPTAVPSTATPTSTHRPSGQPSNQPSAGPTGQPVSALSGQPSTFTSGQPTGQPIGDPSAQPSRQPLSQPTGQPSVFPTSQPSAAPTCEPAADPTSQPSVTGELPDVDDGSSSSNSNGQSAIVAMYVIPVAYSMVGAALVIFCLYYRKSLFAGVSGKKKNSLVPIQDDSSNIFENSTRPESNIPVLQGLIDPKERTNNAEVESPFSQQRRATPKAESRPAAHLKPVLEDLAEPLDGSSSGSCSTSSSDGESSSTHSSVYSISSEDTESVV